MMNLIKFAVVALLWGVSNPLMAIGARKKQSTDEDGSQQSNGVLQWILSAVMNIHFVLPLVLNKLGSVVNTALFATECKEEHLFS